VRESATLADRFQEMKSLVVDLAYFGTRSVARLSQVKYTVNLAHARSLFRFQCPNNDCTGGDFDLSAELANAVAARRTTATGEVVCQGWHRKSTSPKAACAHTLRYTLNIGY